MKTFDCFTFYDEFDLLRLRLLELWDHVDYFVLAEANKTFTNQDKPYYFEDRKDDFSAFLNKIIHIKVDDFPTYADNPWIYEYHQRNALSRGLTSCNKDDLILLSDVDEIPYSAMLGLCKAPVTIFGMRVFYYMLNIECSPDAEELTQIYKRSGTEAAWFGTRAIRFGNLSTFQNLRNVKAKLYPWWRIDKKRNPKIIENGGWHFSYLRSQKDIKKKLASFSHQEYNTDEYNNLQYISGCIDNLSPFDPGRKKWIGEIVDLDSSMPKSLRDNPELFASWIKSPQT